MGKRELMDKLERAFEMVIAVSGRLFKIMRDEEDRLTITESSRGEPGKRYTGIHELLTRFKIDGNPLRDYLEAATVVEFTALLDA